MSSGPSIGARCWTSTWPWTGAVVPARRAALESPAGEPAHVAPSRTRSADPLSTSRRRLTFDPKNRSSIVELRLDRRENARQVREEISSEMWEQINRFYLTVRNSTFDVVWRRQPHEFFRSVKEGVHFFQGLTDSTLGHEEGWQFIQVGRYLDRAVDTVALLSEHYVARRIARPLRIKPSPIWNGSGCCGAAPHSRPIVAFIPPTCDADRVVEFPAARSDLPAFGALLGGAGVQAA